MRMQKAKNGSSADAQQKCRLGLSESRREKAKKSNTAQG
jgi:hypothetical protein